MKLRPWDIPGTGYALFYLVEAIILGDWMRRKGCSHLHVHFGGSVATVGMLTSIAWEIPYSLTIHGPEEFYDVGASFLEQKIRLATFVTCISHYCRSQLLKISPVAGLAEVPHLPPGRPDKGLRARRGRPRATLLHIVKRRPAASRQGTDDPAQLLPRAASPRNPCPPQHRGRRQRHRHPARLHSQQQSRRLCHAPRRTQPSRHPASSLAPPTSSSCPASPKAFRSHWMEAMSMEIACISTYVAGIPELIEPGEQGLLVPPSSVQALTDAMASLLTNHDLRRIIASAGRRKVLSSYDLSTNIGHLIDVFEQHGLAGTRLYEKITSRSIQFA